MRCRRNLFLLIVLPLIIFGGYAELLFGAETGKNHHLLIVSSVPTAEKDLAELLDLRRNQGWRVTVNLLPPDASEQKIKVSIDKERTKNLSISHLLLVGSDKTLPMSRTPNFRIQTTDTDPLVASDAPYGNCGLSRLPTGRLPVTDPATLKLLARKIVAYEQSLDGIRPELFVLTGRQPADTTPRLGGLSEQTLVDMSGAAFLQELRGKLVRIRFNSRTAFPGPDHFEHSRGVETLREGLMSRPFMAVYAGHADRNRFATCHDAQHISSIDGPGISSLALTEICGPFFSGGCSMVAPGEPERSIGELLALAPGGPVAFAGYTGINDDFIVMQTLEILTDELTRGRRTTIGELLEKLRVRLAGDPQSGRSLLIEAFMRKSGQLDAKFQKTDYPKVVEKNNAMLTLIGDPCTTVVIP